MSELCHNGTDPLFDLWVPHSVAAHSNEFIRPRFLQLAILPGSSHDRTGQSKQVTAQKFMLLKAHTAEDQTVLIGDLRCFQVWSSTVR